MSELEHGEIDAWRRIIRDAPIGKRISIGIGSLAFLIDRHDNLTKLEQQLRQRDERIAELERQVDWLERNSAMKTPRQASIRDYIETMNEPESSCPGSEGGLHGEAWYDGEECSQCGDPELTTPPASGGEDESVEQWAARLAGEMCQGGIGDQGVEHYPNGKPDDTPRATAGERDGTDNLLSEMEADIDSLSDEELRAEAAEDGFTADDVRQVVDRAIDDQPDTDAGEALEDLDLPGEGYE